MADITPRSFRVGPRPDPHAVVELLGELGADLDGQPGLADATDTGQRDQTLGPHHLGDTIDLTVAPDERADLAWEVAREVLDAAQDGELRWEPVGHHLEHRDRAAKRPQTVVAQGTEGCRLRTRPSAVSETSTCRPVREGQQPRGPVHLCPDVAVVALDGLTRVQRYRDGVIAYELTLRLNGSRDCVQRRRERGAEAVAPVSNT